MARDAQDTRTHLPAALALYCAFGRRNGRKPRRALARHYWRKKGERRKEKMSMNISMVYADKTRLEELPLQQRGERQGRRLRQAHRTVFGENNTRKRAALFTPLRAWRSPSSLYLHLPQTIRFSTTTPYCTHLHASPASNMAYLLSVFASAFCGMLSHLSYNPVDRTGGGGGEVGRRWEEGRWWKRRQAAGTCCAFAHAVADRRLTCKSTKLYTPLFGGCLFLRRIRASEKQRWCSRRGRRGLVTS